MNRSMKKSPLLISVVVFAIVIGAMFLVYNRMKFRFQNTLGHVLTWEKGQTDDQVLLLLPNLGGEDGDLAAYLMNRDGSVFHRWGFDRSPSDGQLLANGNLLVTFSTKSESDEVAEFDWNGNKVWSHTLPMIHDDVIAIDDNRVAVIQPEPLPTDAKARFVPDIPGIVMNDTIVVLDKSKKEVSWSWSFTDALFDLHERVTEPDDLNIARMNSIQYVSKTPWSEKPAFVVSLRQLSTVLVIEEESKKVLWTSPRDLFNFQNEARLLDDGKLLVFDGGLRRSGVDSRILLINPQTNQIEWKWSDSKKTWAAASSGGVQKLSNGHHLVTNSALGQAFELNAEGGIVWNFVGRFDFADGETNWWPGMKLHRVRAYPRPSVK